MAANRNLTMTVFALIVLNDLGDTLAQLLMKKALGSVTFAGGFFPVSLVLWLGILVYTLNFFIWILVLYKTDLSVAMPVGSTSYIFVPLAAMIFLNENVNIVRWAGIGLIVAGIHFVSRAPHSGTPERRR